MNIMRPIIRIVVRIKRNSVCFRIKSVAVTENPNNNALKPIEVDFSLYNMKSNSSGLG